MWLFVSFDLPSTTPEYRKIYHTFVKELKNNGLVQLHESLFYRQCHSIEITRTIKARLLSACPAEGKMFICNIPANSNDALIAIEDKKPRKIFDNTLPASFF